MLLGAARWFRGRMAATAVTALLLCGCVAPPQETAFPAADDVPTSVPDSSEPPGVGASPDASDAADVGLEGQTHIAPVDQTVRASSLERRAKEMTVRVRTTGCGALGTGSGFAIGEGLIVTNRHVIEDGTAVSLNTWDGGSIQAQVHGVDVADDLALVRVDRTLPSAGVLAADDPPAGTEVTVVGYPLGGHLEFVRGDVVDYARLDSADGPRVLRLSAEIWPGNSGGPVLDDDGRVVGVVFAIERGTDYALAVPVSQLHELLDRGPGAAPAPTCAAS